MTERVVEFGGSVRLTGILNEPENPAAGRPVLLLLNSGALHRVGPCRLYVRLARRLAQQGIGSLRFDFSGIGDSPPRTDGKAFHEYSISEVADAVSYLEQQGYEQFYLLGICSGADTAWYSARADERISGLILLDGFAFRNIGFYWNHYKCRILSPRVWLNFMRKPLEAFSFLAGPRKARRTADSMDEVVFDRDWPTEEDYYAGISELAARKTDCLYIFTSGAANYLNHASQLQDSCSVVSDAERIAVTFWPEVDHMISGTQAQEDLMQLISVWLKSHTATA
jgi:pimeloyl-ACP methyl ester carboxylesterase